MLILDEAVFEALEEGILAKFITEDFDVVELLANIDDIIIGARGTCENGVGCRDTHVRYNVTKFPERQDPH